MFGRKKQHIVKNAPVTEAPEKKEKAAKKSRRKKERTGRKINFSPAKTLASILDGTFLTRELVLRWLPFALFMVFLAMVYIANNYAAQRKIRAIDQINREIKELRNEHISTKSELMYMSKMSEVAKKLENEGIKEAKYPPKKIFIDQKQWEELNK